MYSIYWSAKNKLIIIMIIIQIGISKIKFIDESMIPYYSSHCSRQQINNKRIRVGFNIWVFAEACDYIVQFESYQGVEKGKQTPCFLNWD